MARGKRAEALTKGTRYVAEQTLDSLYDEYRLWKEQLGGQTFGQWAVTRVWDVEYKPTAGRLVVVLDLNEPAESLPTEPTPVGPYVDGTGEPQA